MPTRISRISYYHKGKLVFERQTRDYSAFPEPLVNLKDLFFSLWWLGSVIKKTEILFGFGSFNLIPGIFLKEKCNIEKNILYSIDFVPKRFNNFLLNKIYHLIDKFALLKSTESWNLSPRMAEGRERLFGLDPKKFKQKVVPVGLWIDEMPSYSISQINRYELIFVGHILDKQGIQLVISAIPEIKKTIPEFKFRVIGDGDYKDTLYEMVKDFQLEETVIFEGAIFDPKIVNEKLARAAVGVAPYSKELDTFTYYADPTKIKTYLAAGLPVILTDVPYNARDIAENGAGVIISYDPNELYRAVIDIMQDEIQLIRYRKAAYQYSRHFDWLKIFNQHFKKFQTEGV